MRGKSAERECHKTKSLTEVTCTQSPHWPCRHRISSQQAMSVQVAFVKRKVMRRVIVWEIAEVNAANHNKNCLLLK